MDASNFVEAFGYRIVPAHPDYQHVELHVFARAYRDAWMALHGESPRGRHWFERLGIAVDFPPRGGAD